MINPDSVEFLPLTQGYVALLDKDVYDRVCVFKWYAHKSHKRVYARRNVWVNGKRTTTTIHSQILPAISGKTIDHIYAENPFMVLDERRSNLRYATPPEQGWNQRIRKWSGHNFKGTFKTKSGKWVCRIRKNGKLFCLGTFDTQEQAALVYDAAAKKHFGEFAKLNFPIANP